MVYGPRKLSLVLLASVLCLGASTTRAVQTFSLNFDTVSLTDPNDLYVYSTGEKEAILDILNGIYLTDPMDPGGGPFGIKFEIFDPDDPPPPFTTAPIKFNNGFMGGAAEKLDYRNTDDLDGADVNALGLLRSYVGTPKAAGGVWTLPELTSSESLIWASANLAAHEAGHALGLRHHDSFGPITTGIGVAGTKYEPEYIGPTATTNASFHVMGLASTVSLNPENLLSPSWFSERSAAKLMHNVIASNDPEIGVPHGAPAIGVAQPIPLVGTPIPNTHNPPDPHFIDPVDPTPLDVFAGVTGGIIGATLADPAEVDYYLIDLPPGAVVTIEVISNVVADTDPTRLPDPVDMAIELIDATLAPVPHPIAGGFTINDNQFESKDSILIDVVLSGPAPYFLDVRASGLPGVTDKTGEYEVYVMGIMPPGPPENFGNYDLDFEVDGWDFLMWQRGESPDPLSQSDLLAWETNYGLKAMMPPPPLAVPEPTSWLLLLGMLGIPFVRQYVY